MKERLTVLLVVSLYSSISFAQTYEREMVVIGIRYQSSFSTIPEFYKLKLQENKVEYISAITSLPAGEQKIKTKKIRGRKWIMLINLVENMGIDSLESSAEQEIDGAWYSLNIEYSDQVTKNVKISNRYAPAELLELHNWMKMEK